MRFLAGLTGVGLVGLVGLVVGAGLTKVAGAFGLPNFHGFMINEILFAQVKSPVSPGVVVAIMAIPMVLIFGNTGLSTLAAAGVVDKSAGWVQVLVFLGQTSIALLITTVIAIVVLGLRRGVDKAALEKLLDGALGPICSVVLITGAGGMFGQVLRTSGIGDALAESMSTLGIPVILACYLISVALRLAQGSATVALTTAAALMAPAVEAGGYSSVQLALIVLATAAGSVFASHVNDSGFWLVGRLMGMDVATTLRTWTMNQLLVSVIGFALVVVLFGASTLVGVG